MKAAPWVSTNIAGGKKILVQLAEVEKKIRTKALRKGLGEGTKKILWATKAKTKQHRRTGQLHKALGRKIKVYRHSGAAVGLVGVRKGFTVPVLIGKQIVNVNPRKYWHLFERGTYRSQPRHALKAAWAAHARYAEQAILSALKEVVR